MSPTFINIKLCLVYIHKFDIILKINTSLIYLEINQQPHTLAYIFTFI